MGVFVRKKDFDALKSRVEALENGENLSLEEDDTVCPQDGHRLIETTSLGSDNRTKMCPKCGRGYGYKIMETR